MVTSGVYTQRCASFDVFISSKQDVPTHLQYGGTQLPTFCHICAKGINMCTLIHAEAHGYEITTLHTHIHAPVKTRPAASSIVAFFVVVVVVVMQVCLSLFLIFYSLPHRMLTSGHLTCSL